MNRPGEIVLRPAHVGDLEPVVELEARTFEEPWSRLSVAAELAQKHALVLLAERAGAGSAGRVVGYAAFRLLPPEAELLRLATLPAQRRRGIALRLVEAGLDELASRGMRRCLLEVRRTNRPARALYERAGFRPVGARRGYYQDGTDAVLYERRIDPA